jgi:hypothetical protein
MWRRETGAFLFSVIAGFQDLKLWAELKRVIASN